MKRLRLLVDVLGAIGVRGRDARKVVIELSSIKYLVETDEKLKHMSWYRITEDKEEFTNAVIEIGEITGLAAFKSYELNNFIEKFNEPMFQKIISSLSIVDSSVKVVDLVTVFRSMSNMERDSGSYITSDNVLEIGIRALGIKENSTVIDSFNGESGVCTTICSIFDKENKDYSSLEFFGQEVNVDSFEIGQLIAYLLNNNNFHIEHGDSIEAPAFLEGDQLKKFDYAVSVPPFALKQNTDYIDRYNRFRAFKNKPVRYNNASWLFAEHVISTLNEKGKAAILMPMGALFRVATNDTIVKKSLVNEDIIEAIIKMPAGILNYTAINTCWVIINKNKDKKRKDKIQFIDLSDKIQYVGRREKIVPEKDINNALSNLVAMEESKESFIVDRGDIEKNQFNLDIYEAKKQEALINKINTGKDLLRLSEVATIRRGVQATKSKLDVLNKEAEKTHYIIGLGNIVDGEILLNEKEKIAPENRWIDLYEVKEGDVLITSKGSALKVAIVGKDIKNAILLSNLFSIRLNQSKYKPEVLKYYFESEAGQELLSTIMKGDSIKSISNSDLEDLVIPNIDIKKQELISNRITEAKDEYEVQLRAAKERFIDKQVEIKRMMKL